MENEEKKDEGQVSDDTAQTNGSSASHAEGKTISIMGKSFIVSNEDLANQLVQADEEHAQSVARKLGETSQELGGLRQYKSDTLLREQEEQDAVNKQEKPDASTRLFDDTEGFVSDIDKKIEDAKLELRQEYQQVRTAEKEKVNFWNSMWEENKDLALIKQQAKDVLKMVGQKYEHENLPNTKKVRDFYAKEAREWLKGVVGAPANGDTNAFIEGGSDITQQKKKTEDKPREGRTKRLLDGKRDKRRQAMANRT